MLEEIARAIAPIADHDVAKSHRREWPLAFRLSFARRQRAVALQQKRLVIMNDVERRAVAHHRTVIEPHRSPAERGHVIQRVRAKENRPSLLLELADPIDALLLEMSIAHCERLVDHQDVGIHIDGD